VVARWPTLCRDEAFPCIRRASASCGRALDCGRRRVGHAARGRRHDDLVDDNDRCAINNDLHDGGIDHDSGPYDRTTAPGTPTDDGYDTPDIDHNNRCAVNNDDHHPRSAVGRHSVTAATGAADPRSP
jgi:hypothetical protein